MGERHAAPSLASLSVGTQQAQNLDSGGWERAPVKITPKPGFEVGLPDFPGPSNVRLAGSGVQVGFDEFFTKPHAVVRGGVYRPTYADPVTLFGVPIQRHSPGLQYSGRTHAAG